MNAKRLWLALLGVCVLLAFTLIGVTHTFGKLFSSQAQQLSQSRGLAQQLEQQQLGLTKSKKDIETYAELEKITEQIVPQDKDQAQTVRELINIAAENNITLTSITFPSSSLGSGSAKAKYSQLSSVKGIPGVYNLQITVANNTNNTVTYNQLSSFLADLENNRRTAAVSNISIQPQSGNANRIVFTLVINTYVKPS